MHHLHLTLYKTNIHFMTNAASLVANIEHDFAFYKSRGNEAGRDAIVLRCLSHPIPRRLRKVGFLVPLDKWVSVGNVRRKRIVKYRNDAIGIWERSKKRYFLICAQPALLYELSYITLLALLGCSFDLWGLHRVHALGISCQGMGALILLGQRQGKTSLALEIIRRNEFKILSDEQPLITHPLHCFSFVHRMGLRREIIKKDDMPSFRVFVRRKYGIKYLQEPAYSHFVQKAVPLRAVLIGKKAPVASQSKRISRWACIGKLFMHLVVGDGLCQLRELMVPLDGEDLIWLIKMLFNRSVLFVRVLFSKAVRFYVFQYTHNVATDCEALERLLERDISGYKHEAREKKR